MPTGRQEKYECCEKCNFGAKRSAKVRCRRYPESVDKQPHSWCGEYQPRPQIKTESKAGSFIAKE